MFQSPSTIHSPGLMCWSWLIDRGILSIVAQLGLRKEMFRLRQPRGALGPGWPRRATRTGVIFLSPLDLIIADGWSFRAADSSLADYAE